MISNLVKKRENLDFYKKKKYPKQTQQQIASFSLQSGTCQSIAEQ